MAGFFESMLPGLGSMYGYKELMDNVQNQRGDIRQFLGMGGVKDLLGMTKEQGGFTPYGIKGGGIGQVHFGKDGMHLGGLTDRQKSIRRQMFTQGQGMLERAYEDPTSRTQSIYDRMRAAQQPGRDRQQAQLQQQMHAQGRGGIRTQAYGGTPEQLAMQKALAEQDDQSYLSALSQVNQEQAQQAQLGHGMLEQGYRPIETLMEKAKLGLGYGSQLQQGQQGMWNNYLNLALGGMGTDVQLQNIKAQMMANMMNAAVPMAQGVGSRLDSAWDWLKGQF
jgi:hypothetical protein